MAKAMDCSKGTIMSRLFHARRNMQRLLRERFDDVKDTREAEASSSADSLTREAVLP
jgi:RNA polymerase sigma-70 factor (ECF subfamily)